MSAAPEPQPEQPAETGPKPATPEELQEKVRTEFSPGEAAQTGMRPPNLDLVMRIPVSLQAVLGSTKMPVASLMKLGQGAVIGLDQKVGQPIDVVVNGRVVARGEVVLMPEDSERFGVSLTEIVSTPGSDTAG